MRKLILAVAVLAAGVVILQMWRRHYSPGDAVASLIFGADTEWAEGFSESAFDSVALGFTAQQVRDLLGEPVQVWPAAHPDNGSEGWSYSWQESDSSNHHLREVVLDPSGRVTKKQREFWVD